MNVQSISKAAEASGIPIKTVRYYADIALVKPAGRTESGYRVYDDKAIRKLIFIRRAREFGFSIDQCRALLGLYENPERSSSEVRDIAARRLQEIENKQQELALLRNELAHLVISCNGDDRPDCPIIDYLQ